MDSGSQSETYGIQGNNERGKTFTKIVHLMKHNYEKSIEVHNEVRVNVDEQQSGIDDTEEVLEITAARTGEIIEANVQK